MFFYFLKIVVEVYADRTLPRSRTFRTLSSSELACQAARNSPRSMAGYRHPPTAAGRGGEAAGGAPGEGWLG